MTSNPSLIKQDSAVATWLIARRRYILVLIDAALVALSLALAYFINSLDASSWDVRYGMQYRALVPWMVLLQVALFAVFHLYRGLLRFAGVTELKVILMAASLVAACLFILNVSAPHIRQLGSEWPVSYDPVAGRDHIITIPRSVVATNWMLTIFLVGGFRFSRRVLLSTFRRKGGKNVFIIGVEAGEPAARAMLQHPEDGYDPVGFVDPSPLHIGRRVHGLNVLGTLTELAELIREYAVEEVIIALPEASGREISEIADICRSQNIHPKILPTVSRIMSGQISVSAIRPVTIEDILGRDPVNLELAPELNYIRDKRVLVTGAGGSIGSEIISQILKLSPEKIILLGRGENSLFEIAGRINAGYADERFPLIVADVRDEDKMRAVFERYRPHVVFHAAAHKHVPFMEINPEEAIKNNVFGTRLLARLASEYGVERFILISTDKAVRPTNVMGASKRVAEMILWDMVVRSRTRFVAVRFGNVLGSRGSVVPTLKRQIAAGGPVTITHREMTRYFMTIPEAASLVVMAGAPGIAQNSVSQKEMEESGGAGEDAGSVRPVGRVRPVGPVGSSEAHGTDAVDRSPSAEPQSAIECDTGRLYVLDMGEPIRILDLIHNIITLSGFTPGKDIEIKEIGLRPGEKIHEELLTAGESVKATQFGKIFVTQPDAVDRTVLESAIAELEKASRTSDAAAIRAILRRLVPDYHSNDLSQANSHENR
ncbi:MAG: nucleoside-diphosphate sugar epimerase/dehydratase [Candidatus Sumerlaeota bacterium]|nr:nucleoside-diphosphate sugar epimerase/dehydratase [Candidatus Sumerlaeota bacterium]